MRIASIIMLVSGVACAVVVVVLTFVARGAWSTCTEHVQGTVIGVSPINYAGHHIPRCEYVVGGDTYTVDGPRFESGTVAPGMRTNIVSREELPSVLKARPIAAHDFDDELVLIESNERMYQLSPLSKLYPIGSEVDIWYDPAEPDHSYVQRPVRTMVLARIILSGLSAALIGCSAIFLALAD